jgi:hypothetical protein
MSLTKLSLAVNKLIIPGQGEYFNALCSTVTRKAFGSQKPVMKNFKFSALMINYKLIKGEQSPSPHYCGEFGLCAANAAPLAEAR